MKIQFVGCGSAFNKEDGQSNILVIANSGKKLLIDCGTYCWMFAKMINVGYKDVDALYVSHLHADHVGGIEEMAFCTYFGRMPRPKLFCNRQLMHELWNEVLRGGLESIQGKVVTLTEYFDCHPVDNNEQFTWEGIAFTPVQTVHVMAGYTIKYSYGLLIQQQSTRTEKHEEGYDALGNGCINSYRSVEVPVDEPTVFCTTDSQMCPAQLKDFYNRADIILHDCETGYKSGVHAHYDELKTLPAETKKKMWLYHYQPNPPQNVEPAGDPATKKRRASIEDGFRGFAARGQIIDVSSIGE